MDNNVWAVFSAVARAVGARDAIVSGDRRLTYAQLHGRSERFAAVMRAHGLGVRQERPALPPWESGQDMVGLYLLNGAEYLEGTLGGYAARVAPFNVNYRYVSEELAYLLNDASAAALVYHARFAATLAEVLPKLRRQPLLLQVDDGSGFPLLEGAVDYEEALAGADTDPHNQPTPSPDDLYVLYTGGTTGMPKGTLWRQADAYLACLGGELIGADLDPDGVAAAAVAAPPFRMLPNAPFMHGAAHWLALRQLLTGGSIVINGVVDRFDPVDMWTLVDKERVDSTLLVGEAFARPVMDAYEAGGFDGSSLKVIAVGGAITSPETKERILRSLPQVIILDAAGASETGAALSRVSAAGSEEELAVFRAQPGSAVLDQDLTRELEPGEEAAGWFAKSGHIPLGYLRDPEKTRSTFPEVAGKRWSVPGDRARVRADGLIELLGRDSVTINSGGEKIFAEEVEQALLTHPDVQDSVVTGRPSERWGQEVVAIVALRPGRHPADQDLLAAAGKRLARYKLPKLIIRVDQVERSPAGKADYRWAQQVCAAEQP